MSSLFARALAKLEEMRWNQVYEGYRKKYHIHPTFSFRRSHYVTLGGEGQIWLGAEGYIQSFSAIRSERDCKVWIGERTAIADHVRISTCQQQIDQPNYSHKPKMQCGDVHVGSDCWLCTGVVITPGVKVGRGTVVGACSVVTHDLPEDCLAAGVPAKVIRFKTVKPQPRHDPEARDARATVSVPSEEI